MPDTLYMLYEPLLVEEDHLGAPALLSLQETLEGEGDHPEIQVLSSLLRLHSSSPVVGITEKVVDLVSDARVWKILAEILFLCLKDCLSALQSISRATLRWKMSSRDQRLISVFST